MITNKIINILEHMPYSVYGNRYYKDRYYLREEDYYLWNYTTKCNFDYHIILFKCNNNLDIYIYKNDIDLSVKYIPKTLKDTLNSIANYLSILGFNVGKRYDY